MNICIEDKISKDINAISLYDTELNRRSPMIILVHDYAGTKENMLEYCYRFAKEGFFTVAFDISGHGEKPLSAKESSAKKKPDFFSLYPNDVLNIFSESTDMLNSVIAVYESNPRVISNKIGLIGISFGGTIVYDYLTGNKRPNIKAAAALCSSPNMGNFINRLFKDAGKEHIFNSDALEKISLTQPSGNMSELKNFPLLILNNMNDGVAAIAEVRKSHEELFFNYTNQDMLKFIEYREGNHCVRSEMITESVSWMKKFLFTA